MDKEPRKTVEVREYMAEAINKLRGVVSSLEIFTVRVYGNPVSEEEPPVVFDTVKDMLERAPNIINEESEKIRKYTDSLYAVLINKEY